MALFGAPTVTPKDAANAVSAAVAMQRRMLSINDELRAEGLSGNWHRYRFAHRRGDCWLHWFRAALTNTRPSVTLVNTASRLESNTKSRPDFHQRGGCQRGANALSASAARPDQRQESRAASPPLRSRLAALDQQRLTRVRTPPACCSWLTAILLGTPERAYPSSNFSWIKRV